MTSQGIIAGSLTWSVQYFMMNGASFSRKMMEDKDQLLILCEIAYSGEKPFCVLANIIKSNCPQINNHSSPYDWLKKLEELGYIEKVQKAFKKKIYVRLTSRGTSRLIYLESKHKAMIDHEGRMRKIMKLKTEKELWEMLQLWREE